MNFRLIARMTKPSDLERELQASLELVELAKKGARFLHPMELPTPLELNTVHAQLARLIREGKPGP